MKSNNLKGLYSLFIVVILPLLSFGNTREEGLFTAANADYARGQYQHALNTYKKILDAGYQSAPVYYNMGNASYRTGDLPSALLYFEKAHKLLPGDAAINANTRLVNSKTQDKIETVPEFFISRWWNALLFEYTTSSYAVMSVILILLASALLILYFFAHGIVLKKVGFYGAIVCFISGIFVVFILNRQAAYVEDHQQAIVFTSPVTVKIAPAEASRDLFVIHDGTKVTILDNNGVWVKIKLANGNEGWMKLSALQSI